MKYLSKLVIMVVIISSIIVSSWPLAAGVDFDITHDDSEGDVKTYDYETGDSILVSGHDDIDILQIKSSKLTVKQNLVLEMLVAGVITKSEVITYEFMLMDAGEMVYMVIYSNGTCTGMNVQSMNPDQDMLVATGDGTDTLTITVPLKNLGAIEEYDFIGYSYESEISEDEFLMYSDEVPDQPDIWDDGYDDWEYRVINIIEPINSTTVFQTCEIKGVSDIYEAEIENVELQIDSTSTSNWLTTTTSDDWSTWNYQWDTEEVSEGEHTIHVRGYDGVEYYYDTITVNVDQETATNPKTTDAPTLSIGDKFEYTMIFTETYDYEDMTMSGNMKMEVISENTMNIDGKEYEVYILDMSGEYIMASGLYSVKSTMYGTRWLRKSDLAIIKEESISETNSPSIPMFEDGGSSSDHEISTYDPPNDVYNFPMKVSEQWELYLTKSSKSTSTYDCETESYSYTDNITMKYECLRTDSVSVPAGKFDVFLVYYIEEYEDSWEDDGDDWEYEDSDNDGWTDDEEEYFGTDPDDPDDYPNDDEPEEQEKEGDGGEEGEESEKMSASEESEVVYYESEDEVYYDYSYLDYTIEYYSPELGFPVKIESYDYNRKVTYILELESYEVKNGKSGTTGGSSDDFTIQIGDDFEISITGLVLFIILIVIIILFTVFALHRRRKKLDSVVFSQMESESGAQPEGSVIEVEPLQPPEQK